MSGDSFFKAQVQSSFPFRADSNGRIDETTLPDACHRFGGKVAVVVTPNSCYFSQRQSGTPCSRVKISKYNLTNSASHEELALNDF